MAQDTAREKSGSANSRVLGLFTNLGTADLGDAAELSCSSQFHAGPSLPLHFLRLTAGRFGRMRDSIERCRACHGAAH
jgi:hypothetical protein